MDTQKLHDSPLGGGSERGSGGTAATSSAPPLQRVASLTTGGIPLITPPASAATAASAQLQAPVFLQSSSFDVSGDDPIGLQILQQLATAEARTIERVKRVVEAYRDPLFAKDANILTFQQHFSMFSNVKSLGESQEVLLTKLQAQIAACRSALRRAATASAAGVNGCVPAVTNSALTTSTSSHHDRSFSTDTSASVDSVRIREDDTDGSQQGGSGALLDIHPHAMDEAYVMEGVVNNFFLDPSMTHFLAEHMMFTVNYCRSIVPTLLEIVYNKDAASKMLLFVQFSKEIAARVSFAGTLLPEHDLLGTQQEGLMQRSTVEELLMLLSVSLPSLRRYIHAARCLVEADGCLSVSDRDELLESFLRPVTARLQEEVHMVRECITTQSARLLVAKMDDFTAPNNDGRVLLHHGKLIKKFARGRHERLALLFSDIFVYVEELSNGRWRVRGLIPLETKIDLRDIEDCYFQQLSNCFEVITNTNKYVFFAHSAVEKREWLMTIDSAIANCVRRKSDATMGIAPTPNRDVVVCGPKSRLARQRRDDARWQWVTLQTSMHSNSSGPGAVAAMTMNSAQNSSRNLLQGAAAATAAAAAAAPVLAASLGARSPNNLSSIGSQVSTGTGATPLRSGGGGGAASRKSLRGSFNVSSWSQQQTHHGVGHSRVKSMDLMSNVAAAASANSSTMAQTTQMAASDVPIATLPAFGPVVHSRQTSMSGLVASFTALSVDGDCAESAQNASTPGMGSATTESVLPVTRLVITAGGAPPAVMNPHRHVDPSDNASLVSPTYLSATLTPPPTSAANIGGDTVGKNVGAEGHTPLLVQASPAASAPTPKQANPWEM